MPSELQDMEMVTWAWVGVASPARNATIIAIKLMLRAIAFAPLSRRLVPWRERRMREKGSSYRWVIEVNQAALAMHFASGNHPMRHTFRVMQEIGADDEDS